MLKRMFIAASSLLFAACAGERPANIGVKDGHLIACPSSPNCVSSQGSEVKQHIEPFSFKAEPDRAFANLKKVLSARSDTVVTESTAVYLRVEFRTKAGFVDDGEFLLNQAGSQVQLRSASRLGYSDLGKNRRRLEEIRTQFQKLENNTDKQ